MDRPGSLQGDVRRAPRWAANLQRQGRGKDPRRGRTAGPARRERARRRSRFRASRNGRPPPEEQRLQPRRIAPDSAGEGGRRRRGTRAARPARARCLDSVPPRHHVLPGWSTVIRPAKRASSSGVPSVDPSSTTISSAGTSSCASTLSIASATNASPFRTGMMTEIGAICDRHGSQGVAGRAGGEATPRWSARTRSATSYPDRPRRGRRHRAGTDRSCGDPVPGRRRRRARPGPALHPFSSRRRPPRRIMTER